ncbi:MAG TPA: hypothetical protein VEL07_10375 [Planctomycetota bacterium]|nr:hypothetical protein [Planctomycetota bacterium]
MRPAMYLPAALLLLACAAPAAERVIFDHDIGGDVDDAGTFAVLHALADLGEIEILAMGLSDGHANAVPCSDALNTWYGRPGIPIGRALRDPYSSDRFMEEIVRTFAHDLTKATAPLAVDLYRRVLAAQPDRSVTLVVVGPATNISDLLDSPADAISPLNGVELVRQKVKFYAWGGNGSGTLPSGNPGFNYQQDQRAARNEHAKFPADVPMIEAGGSGARIQVGSCYLQAPADHPVRICYENYFGGVARDRPSWDQLRLLFGSRPAARPRFDVSPFGDIVFDASAFVFHWRPAPDRRRAYAYVPDAAAMRAELNALMMHMPTAPLRSARIDAPAYGAALIAGRRVDLVGSGDDLQWSVDVINDSAPPIAQGAGRTLSFVVPAHATTVGVTLTGFGGSVVRLHAVQQPPQPPEDGAIRIDFLPAGAAVHPGYLPDTGEAYAARTGGLAYGWLGGAVLDTRDRDVAGTEQRTDTFNHMQKFAPRTWEVALPDGTYDVRIGMGDARYADQTNTVFVEDLRLVDADGIDRLDEHRTRVRVADGRLTIRPDANAGAGAKIGWIDIARVADTTIRVNFQPAAAPAPSGFVVDGGAVFAARGVGLAYGWDQDVSADARDRGVAGVAQEWDTFIHLQKVAPRRWEIALPNGSYEVRLALGDARYADQTNHVFAESVRIADPDGIDRLDEHVVVITVTDGRLAIRPDANLGAGAKLCFIEITAVPASSG